MTTPRTTPGAPSRTIAQSCPGDRGAGGSPSRRTPCPCGRTRPGPPAAPAHQVLLGRRRTRRWRRPPHRPALVRRGPAAGRSRSSAPRDRHRRASLWHEGGGLLPASRSSHDQAGPRRPRSPRQDYVEDMPAETALGNADPAGGSTPTRRSSTRPARRAVRPARLLGRAAARRVGRRLPPAQPGPPDHAAQLPPGVGRHRVAVVQLGRRRPRTRVGRECHQVGVLTDRDARPCAGSPTSRAGASTSSARRGPAPTPAPARRSTPAAGRAAATRCRPRPRRSRRRPAA